MFRAWRWLLAGHKKLPWKEPKVELLGRDDAIAVLRDAARYQFTVAKDPDRSLHQVIYASGRSGIGKTAIGLALPHILADPSWTSSMVKEGRMTDAERQLLENSAYLFIDCNGGGDAFDSPDLLLEPSIRLGWRLLAAVCRDTLGICGVRELRGQLTDPQNRVCKDLGKEFPNVASLLQLAQGSPGMLSPDKVLGALAKDLRPDGAPKERVAIIVHVDEHQLMWGRGLADGASEEAKLDLHKQFLQDLCALRGNGYSTWCEGNNIFLFPIFTGTASDVLKDLVVPIRYGNLRVPLPPLPPEAARELLIDTSTYRSRFVHPSWIESKLESGSPPIDFVLSELGCIPRLVKRLPLAYDAMTILSKPFDHAALHLLLNKVSSFGSADSLPAELMRLIVSGAPVLNNCVVEGKTILQHERSGAIVLVPADQWGSRWVHLRVPAVDYRAAILKVKYHELDAIAQFANLNFDFIQWQPGKSERSGLWKRMMQERFCNMIHVQREILGREAVSISELYPGCVVRAAGSRPRFPFAIPTKVTWAPNVTLCRQQDGKSRLDLHAWKTLLKILDGTCTSALLSKDHPSFDVIHLQRDGVRLLCFLEQLKHRVIPTKAPDFDHTAKIKSKARSAQARFCPVMKEMVKVSKAQGLDLRFVPVFCDGRLEDATFWSEFWMDQALHLPVVATVTGTKNSLPALFPCLEHRFAMLDSLPRDNTC